MSFLSDLEARGLVHTVTEGLDEHLAEGPITAYIGFDPTADSLHVGHLLQIMALARFQRAGHRPIALVGGGTGMIGDPSGKTKERQLLTRSDVEANVNAIRVQLERFLDFGGDDPALLVDNYDWLGKLSLIEFMRDVGKNFTVNYLLAKDSVSMRMEQEEGMSVTEFSYSLLQAQDYQVLFDRHDCTLQMGGSDQWGNITAGLELIRRTREGSAHALVQPLVTTAAGVKFGKTESGAVWLSPYRTSPYRFFQFWMNTDDRDVEKYLKWFTFIPVDEIEALAAEHAGNPGARVAHRRLAEEVTRQVHGEDGLERAERATGVLFGSVPAQELPADELLDVFSEVPSTQLPSARFADGGMSVIDLLAESGVASSKGEARRLISGGGVYLNGERLESVDRLVTTDDAIEGQVMILRKGKRKNHIVQLT